MVNKCLEQIQLYLDLYNIIECLRITALESTKAVCYLRYCFNFTYSSINSMRLAFTTHRFVEEHNVHFQHKWMVITNAVTKV